MINLVSDAHNAYNVPSEFNDKVSFVWSFDFLMILISSV